MRGVRAAAVWGGLVLVVFGGLGAAMDGATALGQAGHPAGHLFTAPPNALATGRTW